MSVTIPEPTAGSATVPLSPTRATRTVVQDFLAARAAGDIPRLTALFADEVDWLLAENPAVPWIRPRSTAAECAAQFTELMEHTVPEDARASVDAFLVDGSAFALAAPAVLRPPYARLRAVLWQADLKYRRRPDGSVPPGASEHWAAGTEFVQQKLEAAGYRVQRPARAVPWSGRRGRVPRLVAVAPSSSTGRPPAHDAPIPTHRTDAAASVRCARHITDHTGGPDDPTPAQGRPW